MLRGWRVKRTRDAEVVVAMAQRRDKRPPNELRKIGSYRADVRGRMSSLEYPCIFVVLVLK